MIKIYKMNRDALTYRVKEKVISLRQLLSERSGELSINLDCPADQNEEEVLKRAIKVLINNGELLPDSGSFNIVPVSTGTI